MEDDAMKGKIKFISCEQPITKPKKKFFNVHKDLANFFLVYLEVFF